MVDDREEREDRCIGCDDAKRLDIEGIVVSRLSVQARLCALNDQLCRMLSVAHGCQG